MMEKEYLQKIAELRQEGDETLSPLLDYLEQYRPGDPRGLIDSESIRCTLDGVVDLELNAITTVMVKLGYKVVYNLLAEDYGWNMARARKEEELIMPFYLPYVLFVKCIGADIAFAIKRARKRRKWKKQRELQKNNPK